MHGKAPTLKEIILNLEPEPVNLQCQEVLEDSDDDDDQVDATQPTQPARQAYKVLCQCAGGCCKSVRLVVYSTKEGIQRLHDLLVDDALNIVCPTCACKL
ncbi:E7 [Macaca mulatta papillomavirus 2]|uniref:Protein E7 n=1 Tax=Macaca mulatta papillomavirus 2 TaxID=2294150 RepID=A0A385AHD0_9PAPI|nr:E7 [Macaca mulatta papillomavirus 2]AXN57281.1 E7 [Macaca mulatta papillomavirus 2]